MSQQRYYFQKRGIVFVMYSSFVLPILACIFVMDNIKIASLDMNFHNCAVVF